MAGKCFRPIKIDFERHLVFMDEISKYFYVHTYCTFSCAQRGVLLYARGGMQRRYHPLRTVQRSGLLPKRGRSPPPCCTHMDDGARALRNGKRNRKTASIQRQVLVGVAEQETQVLQKFWFRCKGHIWATPANLILGVQDQAMLNTCFAKQGSRKGMWGAPHRNPCWGPTVNPP